jgi:3-oxoacyl-[acyl-carrier protein] reductase
MAEFKASTPLKRVGQPEEIAAAIAFLADSLFMTGETIDVNGGWFMR